MATADVSTRAKRRGFTLIELMVGLAIVALLLLLGMPSFTTFLRNSEIRSTAESIINGLRTASAEATRQNTRVVFTLAGASDASWVIKPAIEGDPDCKEDPAKDTIQQYSKKEAGGSAKITITPGGKSNVCFNGLGRILNQGVLPSDHIQQIDVASTVAGEARSLRIIVDDPAPADPAKPRGMRMCDPDPALGALVPPDPRAC